MTALRPARCRHKQKGHRALLPSPLGGEGLGVRGSSPRQGWTTPHPRPHKARVCRKSLWLGPVPTEDSGLRTNPRLVSGGEGVFASARVDNPSPPTPLPQGERGEKRPAYVLTPVL